MTAFYNPTGSVPFSALPQLPAGAIVGNNTTSTGNAAAMSGFPAPTTVTTSGTINYTGLKTSIIVNASAANTQTLGPSPVIGSLVNIQSIGTNSVAVLPPSGYTINGQASLTLAAASSGGIQTNITLRCDSSTNFIVE
jgi:hypothetical protein